MVILPSFHLTIPSMMKRRGLDIASYSFSSFRIANTISQPPTICGCSHHGFHGNISWNIFAVSYCLFLFFYVCSSLIQRNWSHLENLVGFFLCTPCCLLPSFIFNYFYFYNIPCLLVYLKILAVSQPMNSRKWQRNAEVSVCFVTALTQSRSKSWIYVLASKINSLSSILRVLFSSSTDFLSYFHLLVIYYNPNSPAKGWKSLYPKWYETPRLKRRGGKNKLKNWKKNKKDLLLSSTQSIHILFSFGFIC